MKSVWKTICLAGCLAIFVSHSIMAQCGTTLQRIYYDTLILGTGNDPHVFSLPQFDPSVGTLLSVKINSTVSLNYGFTLKNVEALQRNFSVSVGRYDHYTSTALSAAYTNLLDTNIGSFLLNPGDSVTKAPYTILSRFSENDSVTTDVVNFLGSNAVVFNYTPITYSSLTGSNIYYYSATANDTIHFSVTYYYCNNSILANDITSFSATKGNSETVKLYWVTNISQPGRYFEIQAANDGTTFSDITSTPDTSTLHYQYDYNIPKNEKGRIYFRLKITEASGEVKYSEIKVIDIDEDNSGESIYAYPNPSDGYINIAFKSPIGKNWDAWIYAASGKLIQINHFASTSLAYIGFKDKLPAGVYFIRIQSIDLQSKYLLSFIIR